MVVELSEIAMGVERRRERDRRQVLAEAELEGRTALGIKEKSFTSVMWCVVLVVLQIECIWKLQ